ncbi:Met-10+-like protein [Gregarina niphandrodes]|uniref:tRNA (guanine(37)-N1)-methyltransferase n=1 Tax=Gregarina niphandrodes TaxID=110365 RepID=A0A023B6E6_GRENI|nr:Met-10+-like protein [Gregarina niphandrodes]EZG66171.1 Met-10+-like protein [Gregarina niphandrodes]|eukprot:XP_011134012.1 Met-10+-like protein [Gregarina niphandrodes]
MGGVEGDWKKRLTEETIAYGIAVDKQLTQRVLKDPVVSPRIRKCRRRLVELPRNCKNLVIVSPQLVNGDAPSTTADDLNQSDTLRVIHLTEVHNAEDIACLRSAVENRLEQEGPVSLEAISNAEGCGAHRVAATEESLDVLEGVSVSKQSVSKELAKESKTSASNESKIKETPRDLGPRDLGPRDLGRTLASAVVVSFTVTTDYDSMTVQQVLQRILPSGVVVPGSFETIGHIAHLNLLPEHLEYRNIIGQVIIDKIPSIKTVVNKLHNLDNEFRNCPLELLAGEPKYDTYHYENGMRFFIDYEHVFWNSRLAGERDRLVKVIPHGAHVYDVMGGVGGFGIYLAKFNNCHVVTNDLNKRSYECAVINIQQNKVKKSMDACNMDGRKFIREMINPKFSQSCLRKMGRTFMTTNEDEEEGQIQSAVQNSKTAEHMTAETVKTNNGETNNGETNNGETNNGETNNGETNNGETNVGRKKRRRTAEEHQVYFLMNLPAIAIDFLDAFVGALELQIYEDHPSMVEPHVFAYCFASPATHKESIRQRMRAALQLECLIQRGVFPNEVTSDQILDQIIVGIEEVRNVAPSKSQYCVHLCLPFQILTAAKLPNGSPSSHGSPGNDSEPTSGEPVP